MSTATLVFLNISIFIPRGWYISARLSAIFQFPIVNMTIKEVVEQLLEKWVLASEGIDCSFKQYWKSLIDDSEVLVKYPHYRHGLCGKSPNHAKLGAKEAFLKFVDNNSQPNGRCGGSY